MFDVSLPGGGGGREGQACVCTPDPAVPILGFKWFALVHGEVAASTVSQKLPDLSY